MAQEHDAVRDVATSRSGDPPWLSMALERAPDVIFVTDAEDRFCYVTQAVHALTGQRPTDLLGRPFLSIVKPGDHGVAQDALVNARDDEDERVHAVDLGWVRADPAETVPVEVVLRGVREGGTFLGCAGVAHDLSARRARLDERLTSERVGAIVELAFAAAHTINNPLAILMMQAGVIEQAAAHGEPAQPRSLEQIRKAIDRIAEVTRDLAAMADTSVQKRLHGRAMLDLGGWHEVAKPSSDGPT